MSSRALNSDCDASRKTKKEPSAKHTGLIVFAIKKKSSKQKACLASSLGGPRRSSARWPLRHGLRNAPLGAGERSRLPCSCGTSGKTSSASSYGFLSHATDPCSAAGIINDKEVAEDLRQRVPYPCCLKQGSGQRDGSF